MQLGLSKKERHIDLWHWFGQVQLSKVPPHQNLAKSLTYNLSASGLHRLLPQLKMHTRTAEMLALPTALAGEGAFFRSSSSSFFVGMLRKVPAMAPLTAEELEAAYCEKKSLQQRELAAAYADSPTRASQLQNFTAYSSKSLRQLTQIARRGPESFPLRSLASTMWHRSLQQKVLTAAYASARRGPVKPCRLQEIFADQRASTMSYFPRPCNVPWPSPSMMCTWIFATLRRTTWQGRGQTPQEQKS